MRVMATSNEHISIMVGVDTVKYSSMCWVTEILGSTVHLLPMDRVKKVCLICGEVFRRKPLAQSLFDEEAVRLETAPTAMGAATYNITDSR